MLYKKILACRVCGNKNLIPIINLGNMSLTGIFPSKKGENIGSGPLELVKCNTESGNDSCGLVQLKHNYQLDQLYGNNYGYRSGLNKSMVDHLHNKVKKILKIVNLEKNDIIIDIGSNDSTLLQAYPKDNLNLIGVDPTGLKFKDFYQDHIKLIPDFFPCADLRNECGSKKAKIITSISMFYDLENPLAFVESIYDMLDDNGVWVFEQSYLPTMIKMNSYDTICHEHLEYYTLKQIKHMTDKCKLKIIDIEFNRINGGSFSITAAKSNSSFNENTTLINEILKNEGIQDFNSLTPFYAFKNNIIKHKEELLNLLNNINKEGKKILGYGASTKGNVILQYCNITEKDICSIAEVNPDKFGCYTPGTNIPIISEKEAKLLHPDYFIVLPWHFKDNIIEREKEFLKEGGKLVFPLPEIEVL